MRERERMYGGVEVGASLPLDWRFSQAFGEGIAGEEGIPSSIRFPVFFHPSMSPLNPPSHP